MAVGLCLWSLIWRVLLASDQYIWSGCLLHLVYYTYDNTFLLDRVMQQIVSQIIYALDSSSFNLASPFSTPSRKPTLLAKLTASLNFLLASAKSPFICANSPKL